MKNFKTLLLGAVCMAALLSLPTKAEEFIDILPVSTVADESYAYNSDLSTHAPLRLTPDKSELVRLEAKAASIIVGNPAHMNVVADSANTLVIVPRQPGASHFTVLDEKGDILMQRHVIVASPQRNYVRVRRSCTAGAENCQSTSVYYCPDMCHEIALDEGDAKAPTTPDIAAIADASAAAGPPPSADQP